MSLMDKIKKVLDEKVEAKEKDILDEANVKYKLDEEGNQILDGEGNPIILEKEDKKDMDDKDDGKDDDEDMDDKDDKKEKKEKVDVKESLEKIFAKADIDEEIKEALITLFNVAVDEKVNIKSEEYEKYQKEEYLKIIEELEERVDKYVSYVAEEWLKENEVEVETGIKVEISENLINSMKGIFEDSYVEVPESKIDLVKEAEETIDNLLTSIDESKEQMEALQVELADIKSKKIVDELSSEMTDTQKEKLGTLTDSIEYKNDSDYKEKVSVIIESYFNTKKGDNTDLNEGLIDDEKTPEVTDRMASYIKAIKK